MYQTQTKSGIQSVTGKRLMGELGQRVLVIAAVLTVLSMLFAAPAAAQLDLCGQVNGTTFGGYISSVIAVIVYAGIVIGTIAIVLGFAAEALSFVDMEDYGQYRKKGLLYGWGLPVFLYGLSLMGNIIGLNVSCLFPI